MIDHPLFIAYSLSAIFALGAIVSLIAYVFIRIGTKTFPRNPNGKHFTLWLGVFYLIVSLAILGASLHKQKEYNLAAEPQDETLTPHYGIGPPEGLKPESEEEEVDCE